MAESSVDLISMADIARLAGQSRATVGNWKSRDSDFPVEYSRGTRGPLYDRETVMNWLAEKGRLAKRAGGDVQIFRLTDSLRGLLTLEESLLLLVVLLALRSVIGEERWRDNCLGDPDELEAVVRSQAAEQIPFALDLLPSGGIPGHRLAEVILMLSELDPAKVPSVADVLLDALLEQSGGSGGEASTPKSVRALMVALAGPAGSVYDPASGAGRLLVEVALDSDAESPLLYGQEINSRPWALAQLNLLLHGLDGRIALGNALTNDMFPDLQVDRVLAHPPWNVRFPEISTLADDPRWIWGEPGSSDSNLAWVQHCLYHLSDGGKAVIALPPKVLFEKGRSARTLQGIIKSGYLDAVIALPPGLMSSTSIACALLVLVKGRPTVNGKPAPTLMVNIEDQQVQGTGRTKTLDQELIEMTGELYDEWSIGVQPNSPIAAIARYEDLAENGFDISPRRYVSPPIEMANRAQVLERYEVLQEQVSEALNICDRADRHLLQLLGGS